jgi:hypothetical protein
MTRGVAGSIAHSAENVERVYLVGFRVQADNPGPELYSLVLYYEAARGDKNRPLTVNGRIVFFRDPRDATKVLLMGDPAFRKYREVPPVVDYVYDVRDVVDLVRTENNDSKGRIVDFINELFDFVDATGFIMPAAERQLLGDFANHLTFHREYGEFLDHEPSRRSRILDVILWSLGAILARSSLV